MNSAQTNPTDAKGTVKCEKELIALCKAVHSRVRSNIASARSDALAALGSEQKLVDACAVIAFFNYVDRVADATGIQVEDSRLKSSMTFADTNVIHSSTSPLTQGRAGLGEFNPRVTQVPVASKL